MKKTNMYYKALFVMGFFLFFSCSDDEPQKPEGPKGDYEKGMLISGEGSGANSGSVSYVSYDFTRSENKIFNTVNKTELGTFLQSLAFSENHVFIVVDNQNTITVANRYTFEKVGAITSDLVKPRYMTIVGDKGYATNWGATDKDDDDFVAVIDLKTFTTEKTIPVALGPERIVSKENKLYVSHKGAFGFNNLVSVIDINTNTVIKEIQLKDNPDELLVDDFGRLIVLSEGRTIYDADWNVTGHTQAAIAFVNTISDTVEKELVFDNEIHPSQLAIEGSNLYYNIGNQIFKYSMDATALPTTPVIEATTTYFYGLSVQNNTAYVADGGDFKSNGKLLVYDLSTNQKVKEFSVALGASKIYFN